MGEYTKELLKAGFWNKEGAAKLKDLTEKERIKFIENLKDKEAEELVDEEEDEQANIQPKLDEKHAQYYRTGYPKPKKRYYWIIESFSTSIEETYFWVLDHLRMDHSYYKFHKITDIFSAAEQSSFWGASQSRLKIQQDNVSQYLHGISSMVKTLFQLVREVRIIDQRMDLYSNCNESKSADLTLKGLFIDLVEGGGNNPTSVYGLATKVGFTILPDLFFNTHVESPEKADKVIDEMKYNEAVKNVLRRKIYSYLTWKDRTEKEHTVRKKFLLKYLRQHWATINMYLDWIKPHLRNIQRLKMKQEHLDSVDIVSIFETAMTEIEIIGVKPAKEGVHPVIMASFQYRVRPDMSFQQDQYQHKGPLHVGRVSVQLRCYGWTEEEINNYKKYRREESIRLFGEIDETVKAAVESLSGDLEKYLKEAGEKFEEESEEKPKVKKKQNFGMADPFVSVFKGFWELGTALIPVNKIKIEKTVKKSSGPSKKVKDGAASIAQANAWLTFKNYRKSHGMITF